MLIPGAAANLAFQNEAHFAPPEWPAGPDRPHMMLHRDIEHVTWRRRSSPRRSSAPAWPIPPQEDARVLLDPAGHPFCLDADV